MGFGLSAFRVGSRWFSTSCGRVVVARTYAESDGPWNTALLRTARETTMALRDAPESNLDDRAQSVL